MPDISRHPDPHHDAAPDTAADRSAEAALHDSFPDSDPMAATTLVGTQAVGSAGTKSADGASRLASRGRRP